MRWPTRLDLFAGLAERHRDLQLLSAAVDSDPYRIPGAVRVHDLGQVLLVFDVVAVDGDDEVSSQHDGNVPQVGAFAPPTQPGAFRGAAGEHLDDEEAEVDGQPHLLGQFGADGDGLDAERRAPHASQGDQVIENGLGGVDRDGKANAGVLADIGEDHGIDADHFTVPVHERAAGVAGVDGRVGLDRFVDGCAVGLFHRANGTDDAASHGSCQAEGIADGIDLLPDLKVLRVAQHGGSQVGSIDLDDCQIMRRIAADHGGAELFAVVHGDFDLAGVGNDVVVGEDVAFLVDD